MPAGHPLSGFGLSARTDTGVQVVPPGLEDGNETGGRQNQGHPSFVPDSAHRSMDAIQPGAVTWQRSRLQGDRPWGFDDRTQGTSNKREGPSFPG